MFRFRRSRRKRRMLCGERRWLNVALISIENMSELSKSVSGCLFFGKSSWHTPGEVGPVAMAVIGSFRRLVTQYYPSTDGLLGGIREAAEHTCRSIPLEKSYCCRYNQFFFFLPCEWTTGLRSFMFIPDLV